MGVSYYVQENYNNHNICILSQSFYNDTSSDCYCGITYISIHSIFSKTLYVSELNHMETEALFTATITIYCGLFYLSGKISE